MIPSTIIAELPGLPMQISKMRDHLRTMWSTDLQEGAGAPSEFRASQLNLVIQFGQTTSQTEALSIFNAAIAFTQRHPGRIILLCPADLAGEDEALSQGKLFTQCYIGESQREMCCCEAMMFAYKPENSSALFDQVSVWLESDLPIYHWFHRITANEVGSRYINFVKSSKRVLFDSEVDHEDYSKIPTPDPWRVRDLADARTLSFKQSIGQVLSTYPPESIIDGLESVSILHHDKNSAQAAQVGKWLQLCMSNSGLDSEAIPGITTSAKLQDGELEIEFNYSNTQTFEWKVNSEENCAHIATSIGGRSSEHQVRVRKPEDHNVLSEAVFF